MPPAMGLRMVRDPRCLFSGFGGAVSSRRASVESVESIDSDDSDDSDDFVACGAAAAAWRVCDVCGSCRVVSRRGTSGGLCGVCVSAASDFESESAPTPTPIPIPIQSAIQSSDAVVSPERVLVPDTDDDYVSETDFDSDSDLGSDLGSDSDPGSGSSTQTESMCGSGALPLLFRCPGSGSV